MVFHTDLYYEINLIGIYILGLLYGAGCPVGGYFSWGEPLTWADPGFCNREGTK